jgi:hypothetical protein
MSTADARRWSEVLSPVRARALTGGRTGDFLLDSRYPNLVYKAHNFPIASGTIVASPTPLIGARGLFRAIVRVIVIH